MPKPSFRPFTIPVLAGFLLLGIAGCRHIGDRAGGALTTDAAGLSTGDLAGPGPEPVVAERIEVNFRGESLDVALYQPVKTRAPRPAVVFLPGLMAADDQYESYARALASWGFVVAVHGWYSLFMGDVELARDASLIAEWLVLTGKGDPSRIGVAGHSMGAKDAVLAALQNDRFVAVVAIDPDDRGTPSVAQGPIASLRVPLLLIGAEVAWQAPDLCAPKESNYQRFFERAPVGTIELTLRGADHVQMLDEPDRFGYGICRCGTADSRQVRITARRATVGFFIQYLQGGPDMAEPPPSQALVRVAPSRPALTVGDDQRHQK